MRFGTVLASRPAYYDRTPTDLTQNFSGGALAPHGFTQRWAYTVPSARKAFVEACQVQLVRQTAAAPVGDYTAEIDLTPSGGTLTRILMVEVLTNAVGDRGWENTGAIGMMAAGDLLQGRTQDSSTGGTVDYFVAAKQTEFDA